MGSNATDVPAPGNLVIAPHAASSNELSTARQQLRQEQKRLSNLIRNEERKRKRLMEKASRMDDADLMEALIDRATRRSPNRDLS